MSCRARVTAIWLLAVAGLPSAALAVEAGNAAAVTQRAIAERAPGVSGGDWLQMILGLLLIIGLIFATAAIMRRLGGPVAARNNHLRLLAALPLGARERIALIQVGAEQIVVGVSASQGVRMLHVLKEPIDMDAGAAANGDFARRLTEMLRRERGDESTLDVRPDD